MAITEINLPNDEFVRRTRVKDGDGKLYLKCINIGQGDWNRQRKSMKEQQYRTDKQQKY